MDLSWAQLILLANVGTTISGIVVFVGFCLTAIGIADGSPASCLGLVLMGIGLAGVGAFS